MLMMKCVMCYFVIVLSTKVSKIFGQPEIETNFGRVRGVWLKTARGADVAGFLGLPYAEPPIGELRFENPRLWSQKWSDIRNATFDGPMCLQMSDENVLGDEDCLYLNVFTPTISRDQNQTRAQKLPVLVYIHGGAFNKGSSDSHSFAPIYLLDYDVLLVTMNYRLNVLGFFSTGSDVAPGNYGLKDAAAALAWVHDNVAAFGGDPGAVTLMGHSSGAVAAQLLSASNRTEGLFHKLITMSGAATAGWSFHSRESTRSSSMHVARLLGCSEDDVTAAIVDEGSGDGEIERDEDDGGEDVDEKIVECMKAVDAKDMVSKGFYYVWRGNPVCIFGPTLEAEGEGAILTVHPERSLSDGLFRDMPWISGVANDEGLFKAADLFLNNQIKDELVQDYEDYLIPLVLEMEENINNFTAATEAIENFYFDGNFVSNIKTNITQLVGDALFAWPSYHFLQKQVPRMKSKVYFYKFCYEGTFSNTFRWGIPFRFGVSHGDDLNYLFPYLNAKHADIQLFNTMGDRTMINIMSEMIATFVKTGVPSARLTSSWEPFGEHGRFMRFGKGRSTDRSMEDHFLADRMAFWAELVSNFSKPIEEYRVDDGSSKDDSKGNATASIANLFIYLYLSIVWFCFHF